MAVRALLFAAVLLLAACSESGSSAGHPAASAARSEGRDGAVEQVGARAGRPTDPPAAAAAPIAIGDFQVGSDEDRALQAAGVIPAWDAVIERERYLARRGQRGAVFGRLGEVVGRFRWLVDQTEGDGSLGIRALVPEDAGPAGGDRVVLHGAWRVDGDRRWYWHTDRIERLPERADAEGTGPDPYRGEPGHGVRAVAKAPAGALPVSEVTEEGGGIRFQVVRRPLLFGDGWEVSDRSDWRAVAILLLPGERRPYGGQDYMTDEERWRLDKGVPYVTRVRRWRRPRKEGELPTLRAISAPMRVDRRAKRSDR